MLRLTGGEFRGRLIETPGGLRTRPSHARLRQALFNSLQAEIEGASVLDLFAGSGSLGFEALSRGAAHVTFVEEDRQTIRIIEKNARTLQVSDRIQIIAEPVERKSGRVAQHAPFGVVFADPPYAAGWEERILKEFPWEQWLIPGGSLTIEWGRVKSQDFGKDGLPDAVGCLVKAREKIYGESVLTTYRRKESDDSATPSSS